MRAAKRTPAPPWTRRRRRHLSSEEELAPLRRQLEDDAYNVERLRQLVDVDGTTSAIAALKERTADELNALSYLKE
ncbi:Hypothetical predicted protein [Cloeon dipterum]|uniref:Uncharacterized protein n=1 Tax=Cloeon dipterum TaxID=197152 RepID=A0A8S1DP47_9INSE|nr:Hypothetical predicted protein [Cloeon dipterum]